MDGLDSETAVSSATLCASSQTGSGDTPSAPLGVPNVVGADAAATGSVDVTGTAAAGEAKSLGAATSDRLARLRKLRASATGRVMLTRGSETTRREGSMAHLGKPLEKLVEQQRARRMSSLLGEASDEALRGLLDERGASCSSSQERASRSCSCVRLRSPSPHPGPFANFPAAPALPCPPAPRRSLRGLRLPGGTHSQGTRE